MVVSGNEGCRYPGYTEVRELPEGVAAATESHNPELKNTNLNYFNTNNHELILIIVSDFNSEAIDDQC